MLFEMSQRLIVIYCLILILVIMGCTGKTISTEEVAPAPKTDTAVNVDTNSDTLESQSSDSQLPFDDELADEGVALEYETRLGATLYETEVLDGPLNVRRRPSLTSEVVEQLEVETRVVVTGLSLTADEIDDHTGHWLRIAPVANRALGLLSDGWVFSKYVAESQNLEARSITVLGLTEPEERRAQMLRLLVGEEEYRVRPRSMASQNFYTFVWAPGVRGFTFRDVPGAYVWHPASVEAKHITYQADTMESAWTAFTDDFTYQLTDVGTGPGVRGLGIRNLNTGEVVFSGSYYDDVDLQGHEVTVAYQYTPWAIERGRIDEEAIDRAEACLEADLERPDVHPSQQELVVRYRYNIDSGERTYLDCIWTMTQ